MAKHDLAIAGPVRETYPVGDPTPRTKARD